MTEVDRWMAHSPMSDPAEYAPLFVRLSGSVDVLSDVIQGVLVHSDCLPLYDLGESWNTRSRSQTHKGDSPIGRDVIQDLGRILHAGSPV
jgi:hypothetical protein